MLFHDLDKGTNARPLPATIVSSHSIIMYVQIAHLSFNKTGYTASLFVLLNLPGFSFSISADIHHFLFFVMDLSDNLACVCLISKHSFMCRIVDCTHFIVLSFFY